jgi:hypothetical protein
MGNLRRLKKDLLIKDGRRSLKFKGQLQTVGLETLLSPKKEKFVKATL